MNSRLACFTAVVVLLGCINSIPAGDVVGQTKPEDTQAQTIKVRTELVEVRTVVTDRQGHIIENLKKDDFELLENNQPQEISFFSISRLEDMASQDKAAEPKSLREQLGETPARTTVLYVDSLHCKGQIYVGGKVDLGGLKLGVYELTVSVKDARSKKAARRTAVIGVE